MPGFGGLIPGIGTSGMRGTIGAIGANGMPGFGGLMPGATGTSGTRGTSGAMGSRGAIGGLVPGAGALGATGASGNRGATGAIAGVIAGTLKGTGVFSRPPPAPSVLPFFLSAILSSLQRQNIFLWFAGHRLLRPVDTSTSFFAHIKLVLNLSSPERVIRASDSY
jgi:hypothetical protein